jgi:hypothetical protein
VQTALLQNVKLFRSESLDIFGVDLEPEVDNAVTLSACANDKTGLPVVPRAVLLIVAQLGLVVNK